MLENTIFRADRPDARAERLQINSQIPRPERRAAPAADRHHQCTLSRRSRNTNTTMTTAVIDQRFTIFSKESIFFVQNTLSLTQFSFKNVRVTNIIYSRNYVFYSLAFNESGIVLHYFLRDRNSIEIRSKIIFFHFVSTYCFCLNPFLKNNYTIGK